MECCLCLEKSISLDNACRPELLPVVVIYGCSEALKQTGPFHSDTSRAALKCRRKLND